MNILTSIDNEICTITLNRPEKHNAFNEEFMHEFRNALLHCEDNNAVKVVIIKANGKNFSAGADLNWMQKVRNYTEDENFADAMILANLLSTLYNLTKPTIAMVQGKTFGGGVGLVAACDIAITTDSAEFSFSEVKLGLIPAVISPYIINSIGSRQANVLFMSAEIFSAHKAKRLGLIHEVVQEDELQIFTKKYAQEICKYPQNTVKACKSLAKSLNNTIITEETIKHTASLIAQQRVSTEAKQGIDDFLQAQKNKN